MTFIFDISMRTNGVRLSLDENNEMSVAQSKGTSERSLVAVSE